MKIVALALFGFMMSACYCSAQQKRIIGHVADTTVKRSLAYATVAAYRVHDSALIVFQLTNGDGKFVLNGLPQEEILIVVSCIGYQSSRNLYSLKMKNKELDIGSILLVPDIKELQDAVVTAIIPPVIVRDGTIEFYAPAFRVPPNSLVEDLLRRMPGIEIDKNGAIIFNGRKVNRITIDGKPFFGENTQVATQSLSADMISRVQVITDKEELERNPDADINNIGHVINLILKKEVKNKLIGRAYAGPGTQGRFELGGYGNIIKNKMQIGIVGAANSINKQTVAIKDLQGLSSFGKGGVPFFSMEGKAQTNSLHMNLLPYFEGESGVSKFTGTGVNINLSPSTKLNSYLQYVYGKKKSNIDNAVSSNQFFEDTVIVTDSKSQSEGDAETHSFNFGGSIKLSSSQDVRIRATYSFANVGETQYSSFKSNNNQAGNLSLGQGFQRDRITFHDLNHDLTYSKRFKDKEGRKLTFFESVSYSNGNSQRISEFNSIFILPYQDTLLFNQDQYRSSPTTTISSSIIFTEPLSSVTALRSGFSFTFNKEESDYQTFKKSSSGQYDSLIPSLTLLINRVAKKTNPFVSIVYSKKTFNLNTGVNFLNQIADYKYNIAASIKQRNFLLSPFFRLSYKNYNFSYSRDLVLPLQDYLTPIPDSTNATSLRLGNPGLKASRHDRFAMSLFKFNTKNSIFLNISLGANFIDNDISVKRSVDVRAVQTTIPINVNGSSLFYFNSNFRKEIKRGQLLTYSISIGGNMSYGSKDFVINDITGDQQISMINPRLGIDFFWSNRMDLKISYDYRINTAKYSSSEFRNTTIKQGQLDISTLIYFSKYIFFENNLFLRISTPGTDQDRIRALLNNTSLSMLVFKKKAHIKLTLFDLLQTNKNFSQINMQNYLTTIERNTLPPFAMLTFQYRFGDSSK